MNSICQGVLILFQSGPRQPVLADSPGVLPQVRRRWVGWGSNPRPADYEKYGPMHGAR